MPIAVIVVMAVIVLAGVFIILNGSKPQREQKASQEKFFQKAYKFLSSNFLSSGQIIKIYSSLASLSIYSKSELQTLSTKYFCLSAGISVGLIAAAIFLFADTVSILIAIAFAVLVNTTMVTKQIDKTN